MATKAEMLYLGDTGRTIGAKDQAEYFRYNVVELFTFPRVGKFATLGTGRNLFFTTATAHLAPTGFQIFKASRTFSGEKGFAGSTIKPAPGDQFSIYLYIRHLVDPFF